MNVKVTMMKILKSFLLFIQLGSFSWLRADALQKTTTGQRRRDFLSRAVSISSGAVVGIYVGGGGGSGGFAANQNVANVANAAAGSSNLVFYSSNSSGKQFQYADAKIGQGGEPKKIGDSVTIDFVMSSTGLSNGVKIYSTKDNNNGTPYRWVLGDKSTIAGLEQAVAGGDGVPPMLPGGIRRVIIQSGNGGGGGYDAKECAEGKDGPGPIPRGETYNRFKNTFCNPTRPDEPELVLDVKLLE